MRLDLLAGRRARAGADGQEPVRLHVKATARITARTGMEMEALTAVAVAALTVYDMCKAIDKTMQIGRVRLVSKKGGKSGPGSICRGEVTPAAQSARLLMSIVTARLYQRTPERRRRDRRGQDHERHSESGPAKHVKDREVRAQQKDEEAQKRRQRAGERGHPAPPDDDRAATAQPDHVSAREDGGRVEGVDGDHGAEQPYQRKRVESAGAPPGEEEQAGDQERECSGAAAEAEIEHEKTQPAVSRVFGGSAGA